MSTYPTGERIGDPRRARVIEWGTRTPPEVEQLKGAYIYQRGDGLTEEAFHEQADALLKTPEGAKSGMLEALIGIAFHERANAQFMGFLVGLRELVSSRGDDLSAVTRGEVARIAGSSELCLSAIESEMQALEHYGKADKLRFEDRFFSPESTFVSQIDLEYRAAESVTNEAVRNSKLNRLQERLFLAADKSNPGLAAENHLIWLLRKMLREQGIDHLAFVEHATVKDDLCGGPDISIYSPFGRYDIQLKFLSANEYVEAYNRELVDGAKKKTEGTDTRVVCLDSTKFKALMASETSDEPVSARKRNAVVIDKLIGDADGPMRDLLKLLGKPPVVFLKGLPVAQESQPARTVIRRPRQ